MDVIDEGRIFYFQTGSLRTDLEMSRKSDCIKMYYRFYFSITQKATTELLPITKLQYCATSKSRADITAL